jgi:hypothetical protein
MQATAAHAHPTFRSFQELHTHLERARRGRPAPHPEARQPGEACSGVAITEAARKTRLALDALWAARKSLRRDPAAAVERLAATDLDGVDPRAVEQVYGEWLRHCARLGLERPYKYHAAFGRGAVLVRVRRSDRLRVVSSIGLPDWPPGTALARRELPGLRRLR